VAPPLELFQDGGATYNPANLTGYAQRITVNQAVVSQPWRLRDGTAAAGPNTTTPSDGTLPRAVIDLFDTVQTFPAGTGLGTQFTYSQYGAAFIGFQGAQAQNQSDSLKNQQAINDQLKTTLTGESGVNVDQEMSLMIQLQNSYSANARVVSAVKDMLDALLAIQTT
jgi:flagellar hook-associated protein 1 FlgK